MRPHEIASQATKSDAWISCLGAIGGCVRCQGRRRERPELGIACVAGIYRHYFSSAKCECSLCDCGWGRISWRVSVMHYSGERAMNARWAACLSLATRSSDSLIATHDGLATRLALATSTLRGNFAHFCQILLYVSSVKYHANMKKSRFCFGISRNVLFYFGILCY